MRVISRAVALSRWKIEQKVGACGKCKFATGIHSRYDYSHSIRRIPSFGFPADNYGSLDTLLERLLPAFVVGAADVQSKCLEISLQ